MDINKIIEAFDKDELPKNLNKLNKMLATVEAVRQFSLDAGYSAAKHETREMYYTTRVVMVEIAHAIKNQIEIIKYSDS